MKIYTIKKHKLFCIVAKKAWVCHKCFKSFTDLEYMKETMESCNQA